MEDFPIEIITEILSRLPVKSLKRFRAVSKPWCCLIDSKDFVKLHFRQTMATGSHQSLILGGLALYHVDLDHLEKAEIIKPPFYYKTVDNISNTCNGLTLVMSEPPVLWNIFSRDYRVLPNSPVERPTGFNSYSKTHYGLGFDSKNEDFKVVRVVEFRDKATHMWICSETRIYSSKSNSWRRVDEFPYPFPFLKGKWGVYAQGALHTPVEEFSDIRVGRQVKIMAFSIEKESHYEVMLPTGLRIKDADVRLCAMGEFLCLVWSNRSRVTIWVMKEYGVRESWTRLLSIGVPDIERGDIVNPRVYSREGDKVLLNIDDKKLVWYDLKGKSVEEVDIRGLPFMFYAEHCVETLIFPDDVDRIKKQGQEKKKEKKIIRKRIGKKRDEFLSEGFKLVL